MDRAPGFPRGPALTRAPQQSRAARWRPPRPRRPWMAPWAGARLRGEPGCPRRREIRLPPRWTWEYTPVRPRRRTAMTEELREDPLFGGEPFVDEGGDIGEGLSNQPPNDDDTPNQ